MRRKTREVKVGNVIIGGNAPIVVQSMCKNNIKNFDKLTEELYELENAGCELIRVAITDNEDIRYIRKIKKVTSIPLVADIHFDYHLALGAINEGIDKIRIDPGNINDRKKLRYIIQEAKRRNVAIRIGINSGSMEKDILRKYNGKVTPEGMIESAIRHIRFCEDNDFYDIVISLKASDVSKTIDAYTLLSDKCDYPFHIGITHAGDIESAKIKSAVGLGVLLYEGIGDTIRISLPTSSKDEVYVAYEILKSLGIRNYGRSLIVCPSCGRCKINLFDLAEKIKKETEHIREPIKIAVMGCVVNGPGESKEADIAVYSTNTRNNRYVIYRKGIPVKTVAEEREVLPALLREINIYRKEFLSTP